MSARPSGQGGSAELSCCPLQVETDGLRRSIQNLGVLITTAAVAHTSVATGEGLRHATAGVPQSVTVTTKDKVRHCRITFSSGHCWLIFPGEHLICFSKKIVESIDLDHFTLFYI